MNSTEKEFIQIMERSPVITILWQNKENWPVELISSNVATVLGYSKDDFLSNRILYADIVHPDDIQLVAEEVKINSENGSTSFRHKPYRVISKKGDIKWIKDLTYIRRDNNGEITHYEGILLDISDLKQTEEKLSEYFHAVESSPNAITITDCKGTIEYSNPKFTEITDFTKEEAVGRNMDIVNSGVQDKHFYKDLWDTILSGSEWRGVFCNKKKNGELFWEKASISSIKDDKNEIIKFIGLKEDITQEREIEKKLVLAVDEAKRANRVKSEFLANMSHEIRTPMNAILGFSEILLGRIKNGEEHEFLQSINTSGKRLLNLINDILDLSKIEADKIELVYKSTNFQTIINNLHSLFSLKAKEKGIALGIELPHDMPKNLLLDEDRLFQILINIVGNSVKFTDKGYVKITSAFNFTDIDKRSISLKIDIEDSGIGIAESEWENVFNAFDQTKTGSGTQYGGTGLGLAISRKLVNLMNGNIEIIPKEGSGSLFRLTLNKVKIVPVEKLAHTKSDSPANTDKQNSHASKKPVDLIPLIETLNTNSMETYKKLSKAINMNLIKDFSEEIYVLGQKYNLEIVTSWSNSLDSTLRNFDKKRIMETLNTFPNLITQIEQIRYPEEEG